VFHRHRSLMNIYAAEEIAAKRHPPWGTLDSLASPSDQYLILMSIDTTQCYELAHLLSLI
ncbi:hypothetical protein, partial [Vreelandella alkaliphila]|uniref:hypothetical protein n=1 Tax=Vreelandella alkaliphila TaxID=272774 RepID=UPI003FD70226